jgi:hypothetical protein
MPQRFYDYGVHTRNAMYQTITTVGDVEEGPITLPEPETNILEIVAQNHKNIFIEGRNNGADNTVTQKIYGTRKWNASVPATGNAFWTVTGNHWEVVNTQAAINITTNATPVELVDKGYTYLVVTGDGPTGVQSSGTFTLVGTLAGDTVDVNGLTYTAVAGAKSNNTEFSIDGTDNADAADLADSITNDVRVGTDEATLDQTATAVATNVVTITCTTKEADGDNILLNESTAGVRITKSGANLTGGIDDTSSYIARAHLTQL